MSRDSAEGSETLNLHASAVEVAGRGLLILGGPGAGKSGVALRMLALGARLVADDRVILVRRGDRLAARAPEAIAGLIEARGLGILRAETVAEAVVAAAVDLDQPAAARMPQRREITYLGVSTELIFGRDMPNLDVALVHLLRHGRA